MNNVSRELIKYHDLRKYWGSGFILDASDKNDTSVLLDYNVKTVTPKMACTLPLGCCYTQKSHCTFM